MRATVSVLSLMQRCSNLMLHFCRIQDLFSLASELAVYSSSQTAPVSEWVDDSGRIVLIGEAAHPSFVSPAFLAFQFDSQQAPLYSRITCIARRLQSKTG